MIYCGNFNIIFTDEETFQRMLPFHSQKNKTKQGNGNYIVKIKTMLIKQEDENPDWNPNIYEEQNKGIKIQIY